MESAKITDWIQAGCAIFGIMGLAWYAVETYRIRVATLAQSAAERRPFIVPRDHQSPDLDAAVIFTNCGRGPILKLEVEFLNRPQPRSYPQGAIGVDTNFKCRWSEDRVLERFQLEDKGVRFTYTDTAGKRYWTTVKFDKGLCVVDTDEFPDQGSLFRWLIQLARKSKGNH